MVLKHSESTPPSGSTLAQAMADAGFSARAGNSCTAGAASALSRAYRYVDDLRVVTVLVDESMNSGVCHHNRPAPIHRLARHAPDRRSTGAPDGQTILIMSNPTGTPMFAIGPRP